MKKLLTVLLLVVISFVSFSQQNKITTTNTVTFTADISAILGVFCGGGFDPTRESFLGAGGGWDGETIGGGTRKMTNSDTLRPGIFTTTLIITSTLDSVRWKFKAAPYYLFLNGNGGLETGIDRWFTFSEDSSIVLLDTIFPRIYPIFPPRSDTHLLFTLNISGAKNRYNGLTIPLDEIEFIGIKGNAEYLGSLTEGCWCADDTANGTMKLLGKINDSTWNFHHEFPMGTLIDTIDYQFCIMYPGADTINGGLNPLANEFLTGVNHNFILNNGCLMSAKNLFGSLNPVNVESIDSNIPSSFNLEQNYPNPFNPSTKIRYSIPQYSYVIIKVFNLLGEEIETLVNSEQSAGVYEATFDAAALSSGIYFYTLKTENSSFTKKMILIR